MARLSYHATLACCATLALGACSANAQQAGTVAPTTIRLFARTLTFQLPADMTIANRQHNGTNVLIEYVPRGETLANWTRLITIQAYRGLGASPLPSIEIARSAFYPAACTRGPIYRAGAEIGVAPNLRRTIIATGCASLPPGAYPQALSGAGEQDFIMMFRDAETVYTINYALRGAPFGRQGPPIAIDSGEAVLRDVLGAVTLNVTINQN